MFDDADKAKTLRELDLVPSVAIYIRPQRTAVRESLFLFGRLVVVGLLLIVRQLDCGSIRGRAKTKMIKTDIYSFPTWFSALNVTV